MSKISCWFQLLQVRRQASNVFEVKIITSVSFSDFIPPTEEETSKELYSSAPPFNPIPTLQFLCASSIRKVIRAAVAVNHKIHIRNFVSVFSSLVKNGSKLFKI